MPAISFSTMKDKIITGEKKQTIRPKKSDYWLQRSEGDRLVGYWKQRTCHCEKLFESEFSEEPYIVTPGDWTEELAKLDGFDDGEHLTALESMRFWFRAKYRDEFHKLMEFVVIRWK